MVVLLVDNITWKTLDCRQMGVMVEVANILISSSFNDFLFNNFIYFLIHLFYINTCILLLFRYYIIYTFIYYII